VFIQAPLKKRLDGPYERLVKASCSEQLFPIPSSAQRYFNHPYSFEYVTAIRALVGDAQRVLIIGDWGGRDYFSLKLLGKSPVVMDIAVQPVIPEIVIADANARLPFARETFDAAVMAEVVEHLPEDYRALREVREVIRDEGCLVLTVPYYHDAEPTHVRIHSPASIERLLQAAGWEIVRYIEKGGGLCRLAGWFPLLMAIHLANLLAFRLGGITFYQPVNRRIAAFDFWLGNRRSSLHRWSRYYGSFIKCKKARPVDWTAMNAQAFEGTPARTCAAAVARRG
jgi:SAM-dependent methyltransferase